MLTIYLIARAAGCGLSELALAESILIGLNQQMNFKSEMDSTFTENNESAAIDRQANMNESAEI